MRTIITTALALYLVTGCAEFQQAMQEANRKNQIEATSRYQQCVANMTIFNGSISIPHKVLGTVNKSGVVLSSLGRKTALRHATWEACEKWQDTSAIINFNGDVEDNSLYYSGIAVKFVKQLPPYGPEEEDTPTTGKRLKDLQKLLDDGLITEEEYKQKRSKILTEL